MSSPATQPALPELARDEGARPPHGGWRYFACGLAVTLLLVAAKSLVEATPAGPWIERDTRGFLFALMSPFREDGPDTTVLDISTIPGGEIDPGTAVTRTTSRKELRRLLETLDRMLTPPAAVGIDVDFGVTPGGWADPGDAAFFDYCLELNRRFPVRLGVWRSLGSPTGNWLGLPRYRPLAAAIYASDPDAGAVPVWVEMPGKAPRLLTLGASLAAALGPAADDPLSLAGQGGPLHRWMFEEATERVSTKPPLRRAIRTLEAPVNYALVRQMERETLRGIEPRDIAMYADRLQGHIVILGEVRDAAPSDRFRIPGDPVDRPGAFLHAAQAFTLTSDPIFEFSHGFRLAVDIAIPVAIMLGVLALRRRTKAGEAREGQAEGADHGAAETWALRGAAVAVVLGAIVLLVAWRIFWLDFVLVMLFLLLHKPFESWVQRRLAARRKAPA